MSKIYRKRHVFGENDYPDSPEQNYQVIRRKIQSNFPSLGYYNTTQDISENLENSTVFVSDAFYDLVDNIRGLQLYLHEKWYKKQLKS